MGLICLCNDKLWNKGWVKKKLTKGNFVFAISQLINHQNLKILIPTPHNTLVIMWCRDKNFQVSMLFELRNCDNKISQNVFLGSILQYYDSIHEIMMLQCWFLVVGRSRFSSSQMQKVGFKFNLSSILTTLYNHQTLLQMA